MEASETTPQRSSEVERVAKRTVSGFKGEYVRDIGKGFWKALQIVIWCLAFAFVWDAISEEKVPEPRMLSHFSNEFFRARKNSMPNFDMSVMDPDECWKALQSPLQILDKVVPEAAAWVRDRQEHGLIEYSKVDNGCYATYHVGDRRMVLYPCFFLRKDGEKACTLAHEYRHSRQGWPKLLKRAVAYLILGRKVEWIVENDAYYYEYKVREAIWSDLHF